MLKPTKAAVAVLSGLEKRYGLLRPDEVVREASDPESPLHPYFTWDDSEAAEKHRRNEARDLIRSVEVLILTESRTVKAVGYVRDPRLPADEQGYISVAKLRTDTELARESLIEEFQRAGAALARAHRLAFAFQLDDEVKSLEQRVTRLARKVESEEVLQS